MSNIVLLGFGWFGCSKWGQFGYLKLSCKLWEIKNTSYVKVFNLKSVKNVKRIFT